MFASALVLEPVQVSATVLALALALELGLASAPMPKIGPAPEPEPQPQLASESVLLAQPSGIWAEPLSLPVLRPC